MRKNLYVSFVFAIMLLLCAMRWKALADVADPNLFRRDESSAKFSLRNSGYLGSDNTLYLTITPLTASGDYSYSYASVSGDNELILESKDASFSYGVSKDITASFIYDVPKEEEVLHYRVRASFSPSADSKRIFHGEIIDEDSGGKSSSSGGNCSVWFDKAPSIRSSNNNYVPAKFAASVKVEKSSYGYTVIQIEGE